MPVYVSTGGYKNIKINSVLKKFYSNKINDVELSGGLYNKNILNDLRKKKKLINYQVHNYFPVPREPFVLNLASLDPIISNRSLNHAKKAIKLAKEIGSNYYSIHAGFLCDIKPKELGKKIEKKKLYNKKKSIYVFLKNIKKISKFAKIYDVNIMIENNVITKSNLKEFGKNPLLMCDPRECLYLAKKFPNNVKMLLDVAHLKVSAKTLGFKKEMMFSKCKNFIGGYHISDNNGLRDSNKRFNYKSWFWKYLNPNLDYYSVEVYGETEKVLSNLRKMILKKINV